MITTKRLELKKFSMDDFDAIHAILGNAEVMYAWEHGFSKKETREWIKKNMNRYEKDGVGFFLANEKATGNLIGLIGLIHNPDLNGMDCHEIGYILDKPAWGRGYAQEGAQACVQYGFDELGLNEVYLQMRTNNAASEKVAQAIDAEYVDTYVRFYVGMDMPHKIYVVRK